MKHTNHSELDSAPLFTLIVLHLKVWKSKLLPSFLFRYILLTTSFIVFLSTTTLSQKSDDLLNVNKGVASS